KEEKKNGRAAQHVEQRQHIALAKMIAQRAATPASGHVEKSNQRKRSGACSCRHATQAEIGRQMGGNECQLKAAREKANGEKTEAVVSERHHDCRTGSHILLGMAVGFRSSFARYDITQRRNDEGKRG